MPLHTYSELEQVWDSRSGPSKYYDPWTDALFSTSEILGKRKSSSLPSEISADVNHKSKSIFPTSCAPGHTAGHTEIPLLRIIVLLPNWEKTASATVQHTSSRFALEEEKIMVRQDRSTELWGAVKHPSKHIPHLQLTLGPQWWGEEDPWAVSRHSALGQCHSGAIPEGRTSTCIRNEDFQFSLRQILPLMSMDVTLLRSKKFWQH